LKAQQQLQLATSRPPHSFVAATALSFCVCFQHCHCHKFI